MYKLSTEQIDFISADIKRRGIEMKDLHDNLLDHVCCIIEENLEENGDFKEFYSQTIIKFFKNELWEIEEETISLLMFKNYYIMKKAMLISGFISSVLVMTGILFKFMHWPGASALLVFGIGSSSLIFLPLLLILKVKENKQVKNRLIILIGMISAITLSLGILFKIMHWPGANMLGISSIVCLVGLFLPIYFITGIRNPETKTNTIIISLIICLGSGLFLALVNSRPSATIAEKSYFSNKQMQEISELYSIMPNQKSSSKITDSVSENANQIRLLAAKIGNSVEELKLKLFNSVENKSLAKIDFSKLENPANFQGVNTYLFRNDTIPEPTLNMLKEELNEFIKMLPIDKQKSAIELLNLNGMIDCKEEFQSWEAIYFYNTPISVTLQNLNQIKLIVYLLAV
jgi:hypothetical protein